MKLISEYYNEDEDRRAEIYVDETGIHKVQFFRNGNMILERAYPEKDIGYIEDAADNWIRGVMKI